MKFSIKAKLSYSIALIVLLTVTMISFMSNYFINEQFTSYRARQQELKAEIIRSTLSQQYSKRTGTWDLEYIHSIGMFSLYEGYIIKVNDIENNTLWDALYHDMSLCVRIMDDISDRMRILYPNLDGEFKVTTYDLVLDGEVIGNVNISFFGPFFLNENDFLFLNSLNRILLILGAISLMLSIFVGHLLAKRLSLPIHKTVDVTKQIADGNYEVRIKDDTNTTEMDMLVQSINHLAGSLEQLERLRKQLTEDVAHELRTPITVLQAHIEALIEGVWEPTTERMQSCYEEISRIGKLVQDLENLAREESSNLKLNKTEVHLLDAIQKTIDSFETEIRDKNLKVLLKGPDIKLWADYDRIRQVLVNLLSNAVKYSKEGGAIHFETFDTMKSEGFRISDDGIGIPKEELPFIFERFYRADKSRNRMTGGAGIGLTIVKSIINAHGGTITVESQINQGTSFVIDLPKRK